MEPVYKNLGKVRPTIDNNNWSIDNEYDLLTIVYDPSSNKSYISRKDVPANVVIDNREYWLPFGVGRFVDNAIININYLDGVSQELITYTLEEAIARIGDEDKRLGVIISFYGNEASDSHTPGWCLYQFMSDDLNDWNNVNAWNSIYYNRNKNVGWFRTESELLAIYPSPHKGDYCYIGTSLLGSFVYRCYENGTWVNTNELASANIGIVIGGNIRISENGTWVVDDEDTGIKAVGTGIERMTYTPSQEDGGTNILQVKLTDGTQFSFPIKNGNQGNSGIVVPDLETFLAELVNNLTTDDGTKALSAAQGVVLDNKISQLGQDLNLSAFIDVNALTTYNATYTLAEAIAVVPERLRFSGKGIIFRAKSGNFAIAYFNSAVYSSGWENADNWIILTDKVTENEYKASLRYGVLSSRGVINIDNTNHIIQLSQSIFYPYNNYYLSISSGNYNFDISSLGLSYIVLVIDTSTDPHSLTFRTIGGITKTDIVVASFVKETSTTIGTIVDSVIDCTIDGVNKLTAKQDKLVSGSNIKTINGESILGSGNISVGGGADNPNVIKEKDTITYYLDEDVLSGVEGSGTGWALSEGVYTHPQSSTEPLVFPINTESGEKYILQMDLANGSIGELALFASIGNGKLCDVYKSATHLVIGLLSDGGQLKLTPKSSLSISISNISLRKIVDEATAETSVVCSLGDVGGSTNEENLTGFWNVSLGAYGTLQKNVNGSRDIAIGNYALQYLQAGERNVALGTFALRDMVYGYHNIGIGADALYQTSEAKKNVSIGVASLGSPMSRAENNVVVGDSAGSDLINGNVQENVIIGNQAGSQLPTGNTQKQCDVLIGSYAGLKAKNDNVIIGYNSGKDTNGNNNVFVGSRISSPSDCSDSIVIGKGASATKSNQIVIGSIQQTEIVVLGNKKLIFNNDGSVAWETVQ